MGLNLVFSTFDSPGNPFYGGGGAAAIQAVAQRLVSRGHRVTVVAGRFPGAGAERVEGVLYRRIGWGGPFPRLSQLIFQGLLPWQVRRHQSDVWVESLTPPFSTACLQKFVTHPVVALTQILAGRAMSERYGLPFAAIERLGLRTYRYAIATSEYLRLELLRIQPAMGVEVIPNGADPVLVRSKPGPPRGTYLLFLGRLAIHQKGLDLLLEAYARVSSSVLPLVIAGSGGSSDERWLARRIAELGLGPRVRLVGRVEGNAKQELFGDAAALVMPSRFEASPLVAIEALSQRVPVICYGIPELVEMPDACFLKLPPFDVGALAEALGRLSADVGLRLALGDAGKQFSQGFDWDLLTDRYEDFFVRIASGR